MLVEQSVGEVSNLEFKLHQIKQINKGSHVKYTIMAESIYDLKTQSIRSFCGKIHIFIESIRSIDF